MNIFEFVKEHALKLLGGVIAVDGLEFAINLLDAAKDGVINKEELHQIVAVATPIQIIILGAVALVLARRK